MNADSPFDQIRQALPEYKDTSDDELINEMATVLKVDPRDVAEEFGRTTGKDRGITMSGLVSGLHDTGQFTLSAGADVADLASKVGLPTIGARDWLNKQAKIQGIQSQIAGKPEYEDVEKLEAGDIPAGLWYQIMKQGANLGGAAAATLATPQIAIPAWGVRAAAALPRIIGGGGLAGRLAAAGTNPAAQLAAKVAAEKGGKTLVKTLVGGGAFNLLQSTGSLYNEAVEAGRPEASIEATAKALPYALAETGPEAMLFGRAIHGSGFTGNVVKRVLKSMGIQGASGGTSEYLQGKLEQSMHPDEGPGSLTPEQIRSQDINNTVIGAAVESVLGGVSGIRSGRLARNEPTNLLPTARDTETGEEIQQAYQQAWQAHGIRPPMTPAQRAQYQKEIEAAYNAPIQHPPTGGTLQAPQGIYVEPLMTRGEELAAQAGYTPQMGIVPPAAAPATKSAGSVPSKKAADIAAAAKAAAPTDTGTVDPVAAQVRDTKAALMPHFVDTLSPEQRAKSPAQLHNMLTRLVGDPKTADEAVATLEAKIKANLEGAGTKADRLRRIEQALIMRYNIMGITSETERESADDVFTRYEAAKVAAKPAATVAPAGTTPAGAAAAAPAAVPVGKEGEQPGAVVRIDPATGLPMGQAPAAAAAAPTEAPAAVAPAEPKEITAARGFIAAVDKGGIPLNPKTIRKVAEGLGLAVSKDAAPEETVKRIRDALARHDSLTVPTAAAAAPTETKEAPKEAKTATTAEAPKKTVHVDVTPTKKTTEAPVVADKTTKLSLQQLRTKVLDRIAAMYAEKFRARNRAIAEQVLDMADSGKKSPDIAAGLGIKDSRVRQFKMQALRAKAVVLAEEGLDPNTELWKYSGEDVEHKTAGEQAEDFEAHLEEEDQPGKLGEAGILATQADAALEVGKVKGKSGAEKGVSDVSEHGRLTDKQRADIYDEQAIAKLAPETLNKLYLELLEAKPSNEQKRGIANIAAELVRREKAGLFSKTAAKAEKEHKQNESGAKKSEGEGGGGEAGAADSGAGRESAQGTESQKKAAGKIATATKVIAKGTRRVSQPVRTQRSPAEAPTSVETTAERSQRNWDAAAAAIPGLGLWSTQTPRVKSEFMRFEGKDQKPIDAYKVKEEHGPKPKETEEDDGEGEQSVRARPVPKRPKVEAWAKKFFGNDVAPNGRPVWENFMRWFGNSAIVNDDGSPLRVFHGTLDVFTVFKRFLGPKIATSLGFHFAADPAVASVFAERESGRPLNEEQANILWAHLRIENPLSITDSENFDDTAVARAVVAHSLTPRLASVLFRHAGYDINERSARDIMDKWADGKRVHIGEDMLSKEGFLRNYVWSSLSPKDMKLVGETVNHFIRTSGYDGVIYTNTSAKETERAKDKVAFIVFHPEQVKSPTANNGNFSESPDMEQSVKQGLPLLHEAEGEEGTYTVNDLRDEITDFIKAENREILQIVPNADAIPEDIRNRGKIKPGTQAITIDGKVWMIADRIDKGTGRAVFMHEVGSHLGIQRMLASKDFQALVAEINRWAARNDGSIESVLAQRALARVAAAKTAPHKVGNETMAYFIEEAINAGIDPKALDYKTDIGRWFRKMWSLFKQALQAIGVDVSTVTPQDIINLAYGAARLQMAGQYHGTAATFPSFDNRYINTGEGNQTYGWGHYLAQARGAGHAYMTADTRRRGGAGNLMRVDTNVQAYELLDWDKKWGEQSPLVQAAFKSLPNMSYHFDALRGDMTGANLYMSLVKSEGGDKKKASEKLESLGIKGVRYMDEFSRNAALNPDITHYVARKMDDDRYWGVFAVSKNGRWDRRTKFIGKTDAELEAKRMNASLKNPTHNMVVFNGNDIQVVHTEPGGRLVGDTGEGQSTRSGKDFYDRATELMKGITTLSPEYEERVAYDLKKNARPLNEYEQQWEKYMNKEWTPSDAERNRLMEMVKVGFIREVPREYWHDQKAYEAYLRKDYRRSMASDAVRAEDEAAQRRKEASGQYAASTRAALQQLEQDGAALAKALGIPVDKFWAAASVGDKSLLRGTVDRAAEMLRKRNLLRDQLEGQQSFVGVRAKNLTAQMRTAMVQAATRKIPRHLTSEEVRRLEYQVTRIVVDTNRDPRIEISDKDAKLNLPYGPTKARKYKLSDVLHHPLLYAAYPELKDVPVEIRVDKAITNDKVTASYILDDKRIVMNLPAATRRQADNRGNLQVLLHEVQHWIQQHEGYARGSSPVYYDISHQGNNWAIFGEVVENWMYVKDKLAATTHPAERKRLIKVRNSLARMQDTLIRLSEITPKEMAKLEDTTTVAMHIIAQYTATKEQAGKNPTRAEKGRLKEHLELAKQAVEEHEDAFHAVMENHGVNLDGLNDVARQYYIRTGGEKEAFDIMKRHDADLAGKEKGWPALLRTDFAVTSADEIDVALPKYLHDALEDRFGESNEYIPVDEGEQSVRAERAFDALPVPLRKPVRSIWTSIKTAAKNGMLAGAITEDLADIAAKDMPSVGEFVNAQKMRNSEKVANELVIEDVLKLYDTLPQNERGTNDGSVNLFIHDSTIDNKWGYVPASNEDVVVDPVMARRFKALSPAGQKLVRAVFTHGETMLAAKKKVVVDAINTDYDERAANETDEEALVKLQRQRDSQLIHFDKLLKIKGTGPYAPLKRFGKYVAVAKSQAYLDAEKDENRAEMDKLIRLGNHYHVEFADTQGEADDIADELRPHFAEAEGFAKESPDAYRYANHDIFLAFAKMRRMLEEQFGDTKAATDTYKHMDKMLRDMYLSTLAESSARKSELRRRGVAGATKDMMRAFATQGRADAHFLASVRHNDAILEALRDMRNEAKTNRRQNMPYLNEMLLRHGASLEYQPHRLEDGIRRFTSVWMLATSPAFYLQQLTQTYMMSLPVIAGQQGYFRTEQHLRRAYGDLYDLVKEVNLTEHINWSKAPADVRDMLQTLTRNGKIDIGIDVETGSWASQGSGVASKIWNKADRVLRGLNVRVESINRATAAIASYRMELARQLALGKTRDEAVRLATKYAEDMVHQTHGSYDGFNTPRLLSTAFPGARTITQFRRFQIIQLSLIARLFHNSLAGESKDVRDVARRSLYFTLSHSAVMGGMMGMPGAAAIMWLLNKLFRDPDDPEDIELKIRRAIDDQTISDLLLNGAPAAAGVNLSGKLGMGQVLSLLPFTDISFSRKGYGEMALAAAGPFVGGLMPRLMDGVDLISKGEYYKGMENMLPNGFGNAMKGLRFATDGVTMRNGDVVLPPDQITMFDATMQGLGLPTTTITHRTAAQQDKYEFETFYHDREAQLKNDYVAAYNNNDTGALQDIRDDWRTLQESRMNNGFKRQPLSALIRAPMQARKRERQVEGGVEWTKSNRHFVEERAGI